MTDALLYAGLVLVWGSTWIMVKFQIGVVPPEASVIYRFVIAAALMFAWAVMLRLPLRFSARDHLLIALQGALIFSTNFVLFYLGAADLTTGLMAVIFSTASIQTLLFSALLARRPPAVRVMLGAALGVAGISIVFWPELTGFELESGRQRDLVEARLPVRGVTARALGRHRQRQRPDQPR